MILNFVSSHFYFATEYENIIRVHMFSNCNQRYISILFHKMFVAENEGFQFAFECPRIISFIFHS